MIACSWCWIVDFDCLVGADFDLVGIVLDRQEEEDHDRLVCIKDDNLRVVGLVGALAGGDFVNKKLLIP